MDIILLLTLQLCKFDGGGSRKAVPIVVVSLTMLAGRLGRSFIITLSTGILFGFGFAYVLLNLSADSSYTNNLIPSRFLYFFAFFYLLVCTPNSTFIHISNT